MEAIIRTDVVIVGAGPTGLSLACELVRYGIDFVILDKNEGITPYSKAIGVQARTLEIYEQIGLAQKAIEPGRYCREGSYARWRRGARRNRFFEHRRGLESLSVCAHVGAE